MAEQRLLDYLRRKRLDLASGPEDIRGGMGDLFKSPPAGVINSPNLPSLSLQSRGAVSGSPQVSGSLATPFMGGSLGFEGAYQPVNARQPPDWGSMLRFNREF